MELVKNVRIKIGRSLLRKRLEKTSRKVNYSNLGLVRKIGIVWDASQPADFLCLSKFYQKMQERNIDVRILGYYAGKELPDQYTAIRYMSCIRREELNFFYHPVSNESDGFIRTKFDILIDINFKNLLPLEYLSSLSNASFKVGVFGPLNSTIFDLMFEIKEPVDVGNYLDQTLYYLEMINADKAEKFNTN